MSDPPRFRSVLGPTGNKLQRKPPGMMKLEKKKTMEPKDEKTKKPETPASPTTTLKQCSSMTASYSSDASSSCESLPLSVASSSSCKKPVRRSGSVSSASGTLRRKQVDEKEDKVAAAGASNGDCFADGRKRCAWITPKSGEYLYEWIKKVLDLLY